MLSPDEFVGAGEVFCVSDLAETVSLSSVGDSDKTSIVEVIVEFCSDTGELVDILVLMMCLLEKSNFIFPLFLSICSRWGWART